MGVEKKNGKWYIKGAIKKDDGSWYHYNKLAKGCTLKKEAEEYDRLFKKQYQDIKISIEYKTLQEVADEMFEEEYSNGVKESTRLTNKRAFERLSETDRNRKINLITKDKLQNIIREFEKQGYKETYVSVIFYALRKVFKYAFDHQYIQINQMEKVRMKVNAEKIKTEMNFWEPYQFEIFIKTVDQLEMKAFFVFSFWMGTRRGETLALQWKDIDFDNKVVSITKTAVKSAEKPFWKLTSPKSKNSTRNISMTEDVYNVLIELQNEHKKKYGYGNSTFVFGFARPFPMDKARRYLQAHLKKINEQLDEPLPILRIHDFRHSHASHLINEMSDKFTLFDIAKRLGDNIDTVTEVYAHWFKDADKKMIKVIDNKNQQENQISNEQTKSKSKDNTIDYFEELEKLKKIYDMGIITDEEFTLKKKSILGI